MFWTGIIMLSVGLIMMIIGLIGPILNPYCPEQARPIALGMGGMFAVAGLIVAIFISG